MNVRASDIAMVAAHAWDVAGAMAAGEHAALVERPGRRAIRSEGNRITS